MSTNPLFPPQSESAWGVGDGATATGKLVSHTYRVTGTCPLRMAITVPGHGAIPLVPIMGGRFVLPKLPRKLKKHLRRVHGVS